LYLQDKANNFKVYNFTETIRFSLGNTMDTKPVRILSYTRSPFGFEFGSEAGKSYVVEATVDLSEWGVVKSYNGTGTLIRFEDERDQVFPQIYYRVNVVE
jgi:hypothetical protein